MIAISEMMSFAVWQEWEDAHAASMMLQATSKRLRFGTFVCDGGYGVYNVPVYNVTDNPRYIVSVVTLGLIAAVCARHDLPADEGKVQHGPRLAVLPYYAALPKERPVQFTGPACTNGPR